MMKTREQGNLNFRLKKRPGLCSSLILSFIVLCEAGCGGGAESTVYGIVTLDGTPLEHGSVIFYPTVSGMGKAASGSINSGGDYQLQTAQTGGLSAGEYAVIVTSTAPATPHPRGGPPTPGKLLTPKRYADTATSGFQFIVEPGSNEINLELMSD